MNYLENDCFSNQQTRVAGGGQHSQVPPWGLVLIPMVRVFALKVTMFGSTSSLCWNQRPTNICQWMVSSPFQVQVIFQIQDILILLFCYIWCIYVHDISEILESHSIHLPLARVQPSTFHRQGWWKAKTPWFRIHACQEAPGSCDPWPRGVAVFLVFTVEEGQVLTTIFDVGETEIDWNSVIVNLLFWSVRVSLGLFVVFLLRCGITLFYWLVNQGMQVNELARWWGSKIVKPN